MAGKPVPRRGSAFSANHPLLYDTNRCTGISERIILEAFLSITVKFATPQVVIGFNNGDELIVPAYYGALLEMAVYNNEFNKSLKSAGNLIQIGATPFTGGSSLLVLISSIGSAAAVLDASISAERNALTVEELAKKDYYQAWDNVKATIDITELGVGGVAAGFGIYKNLSGITKKLATVRAWTKFNNLCKGNVSLSNTKLLAA